MEKPVLQCPPSLPLPLPCILFAKKQDVSGDPHTPNTNMTGMHQTQISCVDSVERDINARGCAQA
jgi:hypothetical protein